MKTFMTISRALLVALVLVFPVCLEQASAQIATHVVISEVYGGGGNTGSVYTQDYIELYNPTASAVDLSTWSVQYASAAGSSWQVTNLSGSIPAHGFFLVGEAVGTGGTTPLPTQDVTGVIAMSGTNGKVALVSNQTALSGTQPTDASIVDLLGYGTAGWYETAATAALTASTSAERKAQSSSTVSSMGSGGADETNGNGWDTNNNSADFVTQTTQGPQNSASTLETPPVIGNIPPSISVINRLVFIPTTGTTDSVTATIQDLDGTLTSTKLHVRVNGGTYDSSITMVVLSGNTYAGVIPATKHVSNGDLVEYFISATDNGSAYSQSALTGYFVGSTPIATLKAQPLANIANYAVRVSGVINVKTNSLTNGQGFIQDGGGGLQMFSLSPAMPALDAGRNATVQGTVINFNGAYELSTPNFTFIDTTGTSALTATTITLPLTETNTNANEGRYVKIANLSTDSTGTFAAPKNYLYRNGALDTVTIRVANAGGNTLVGRAIPATPVDAMGILSFNVNHLRLLPRVATDMGFDPGDGSGTATISPISKFPSVSAAKETLVVTGDGVNTIGGVSVTIPSTWTWDGSSFVLSGAGFSGASGVVSGTGSLATPWVITISSASVTAVNTGRVAISNLTSPGTLGTTTFSVQTKGNTISSALAPIAISPTVNITGGFEAIQSGNWNQTATWSGGVVPTAANDVTMGTLGVTVTITADAACHNLTMTGSGSATNSGPMLQFGPSGAITLTVNGDLSITGGSGTNERGGRPKLTSNFNTAATLILKGDITANSSNSEANGHPGLNMNEGSVKLTGATTDSIKNGAGFRLANLEIGDGSAAKTMIWAQTATNATMNVRSLRVRTNATFWAGGPTPTNISTIGNSGNDTLPHLDGGILIDAGGSFLVNEATGGASVANINLEGGGITNNGTFNLVSTGGTPSYYNINVGTTGGAATATHTIGGANAGNYANLSVLATDTLVLSQDMLLASGDSVKLLGGLAESAGNTVHGRVVATRTLSTGVADNFGGVGATINAAGAAPGVTILTRTTEIAQTGNSNSSIKRFFDISPSVNAGLDASLEFSYDNSELNGQTAATLSLWKSTDAGTTWSLAGGTPDAPNRKITLAGIGSFSRWTAADATHPLGIAGASYIVNAGWNMISLPLSVADPRKTIVYPSATTSAYAYANGYITSDSLFRGLGYWLKFAAKDTIDITGAAFSLDTVDLAEGWNMIGTISNPMPTAAITQIPGGVVVSPYYAYATGYAQEDTLKAGQGYWVKANTGGGQIVLSAAPAAKASAVANPLANFSSLTIADKDGNRQTLYFGAEGGVVDASRYELPPAPPAGSADVRFVSGRSVETYPAKSTSAEYGISVKGMRFPVTVSWKVAANAERGFVLTDAMNGKLAGIQKLAGEGSMTVNAAVNQLVLKVTGAGALPKEFALGANYPNPFNPSTKFQIALPADAYVEVAVFDILGRKVATLVNDVVPAGYQTIEWNGVTDERAPAMTGVYFVRMVSGTFNKIQKIMLMK